MRKTFAALAAALLALSLSACQGDSADNPEDTGTETNTYRGEALTCVEDGAGKSKVRTCDFEAFYATHPTLLPQSIDDADTEGVWWGTYKGEPLPCYKERAGSYATLSCDFAWFHALHPSVSE